MSNGLIKVTFEGRTIQLMFGMMAIEEIGTRQQSGQHGWCKILTDIIYGGYVNDQYLEGQAPEMTYREIALMVDSMVMVNDPQLTEIFKCFGDSKAGAQLFDAVKKKMEGENPDPPKRGARKPKTKV